MPNPLEPGILKKAWVGRWIDFRYQLATACHTAFT
jgi:hypothetical protein